MKKRDPKKKRLMTQMKYLSLNGTRCPKCESNDICTKKIEINGKYAEQENICETCKFEWKDIWTLAGYIVYK